MTSSAGARAVLATFVAIAALLLPLLAVTPAWAHTVGVSTGDYTLDGPVVRAKVALARTELTGALPKIDANGDRDLDAKEIDAATPILAAFFARIELVADSGRCHPLLTSAKAVENDGLVAELSYACPPPVARVDVDASNWLGELSHGHRHVAKLTAGGASVDEVLYKDHARAGVTASGASTTPHHEGTAFEFFKLGIEHILGGYDHLVFLFALVIVGGRPKSLLWVVTAFTIAHSISLGLAVLDVWSPSPRIVEPAIALSIAYVGVENFLVKDAEKRWRITFPFGLVHGFGFAGALREVELPREAIPKALACFNLGVEAGQLAVVIVVLPLVLVLSKKTWWKAKAVKGLSAAVVVLGLVWFVTRIVSPG
ncbi:MAG: HupE/UreJ family protein [Polyangiaceae bacterium]